MAIDIGIDINVDNSDAIRGIAGVKLALAGLRREQGASGRASALSAKQLTAQTKALHAQSNALRGLTLQYGAVRRAALTMGVRGAIAGFTAIISAANSAAVSITAVATSLGNLGGAVAVGGGLGGLPAMIQGFGVLSLALKGVGKALSTTGHEHELAMQKLIKPARDFVNEVKKMKGSFTDLQLLAQKGFFPGATKGLQSAMKILPVARKAVWNTAQAWGYLAERAGFMIGKRGKEIDKFFQRNVKVIERGGDSVLNFGAAFLDASNTAGPLIKKMSKQVKRFSQDVKNAFESKEGKKTMRGVFDELSKSWSNWTAIFGNVGSSLFNVWKAIQPVVHKVEDAIEKASGKLEDWIGKKGNQDKITKFFDDSLGPMGEFLKLLGGLGELWVEFASAGNDDAERIFRGLRTKVIPILRELFIHLDEHLLPKVIDLGGAFADFIKEAMPGLKLIGQFAGILLSMMTGLLNIGSGIVRWADQLGSFAGLVASLAVGAAVIASWVTLKREMSLAFLLMRRGMGLAPGVQSPRAQQFKDAAWPYRAYQNTRHLPAHVSDRYSELKDRGLSRRPYRSTNITSNLLGGQRTLLRPTNGDPLNGGVRTRPASQIRMVTMADPTGGRRYGPARPGVSMKEGVPLGVPRVSRGGLPGDRTVPRVLSGKRPPVIGGAGQAGMAAVGSLMSNFLLGAALIALPIAIAKVPGIVNSMDALKTPEAKKARALNAENTGHIAGRAGKIEGPQAGFASSGGRPFRNFATDIDAALKAGNSKQLSTLVRHIRDVGKFSKDVNQGRKFKQLATDVAAASAATTDKLLGDVAPSFEAFAQRGDTSVMKIRDGLAVLQNDLGNKLPAESRAYKEAMASSFSQAADSVKAAMDSGIISAKRGMREIRRLTEEQFKTLGFTKKQARNYLKNPSGDLNNKPVGPGSLATPAVGGIFVGNKGQRGRDEVPAVLNGQPALVAKGEYVGVMNAQQQGAFDHMARGAGYGSMEGFFKTHNKPHYMASGGIVSLGHKIQKMGPYTVGEHPAFGGVQGQHAPNGYHYKAGALDINADGAPGGEAKWLDKLASFLDSRGWHYLWKVANHFDHLHVDVANGQKGGVSGGVIEQIKRVLAGDELAASPLKSLVQGSLDKTRDAANSVLSQASQALGFSDDLGGFTGGGNKESNVKLAKRMAAARGWQGENWTALKSLWTGESHFDHLIANPSSGAYGIPQALPGNKMASAGADWKTNPVTQIDWGLDYIKDRYGSPAAAYKAWLGRNPHWYEQGGVIPAFAGAMFSRAPKPPDYTDPPDTDPSEGQTGKTIDDQKKAADKNKKKTVAKKKKQPNYAPGGRPTARGIPASAFKPNSKKPKPRARKKIRKLVKKPFDQYIFGAIADPITGERISPESVMPAFQLYDKVGSWVDAQGISLAEMISNQGLTEEQALVTLFDSDQHKDLSNYLTSIGQNPSEWMAKYGDQLELVNANGMTVQGEPVRGIKSAVDELDAQLGYHSSMSFPFGSGGFLGAFLAQQRFMESVKTEGPIKQRRDRLMKIKKAFEANVAVRKSYKKKLGKMKQKNFGWSEAVDHNQDIITQWRRWLRDTDGETLGDRRKANSEIDRLTDENKGLRKKKPKGSIYGSAEYQETFGKYQQRGTENQLLVGQATLTQWSPGSMGGAAGRILDSLSVWQQVQESKEANLAPLAQALSTERTEIATILADKEKWTGTKAAIPQEVKPDDNSAEQRDALLKQIGLDSLKQGYLGRLEGDTLANFASMIGRRYIGAFAHGGLVRETGMALVHKGEHISPDPAGPFRGNMNSMQQSSDPVSLTVVVQDETGRVLRIVDSRMKRNATNTSKQQGRNTRAIRSAPGR